MASKSTAKSLTKSSSTKSSASTRRTAPAKAWSASDAKIQALSNVQAIAEYSPDGKLLEVNANYLKLVGFDWNEIQGKTHRDLIDSNSANASDYKELWESLAKNQTRNLNYTLQKKDGSQVPVSGTFYPLLNVKGEIIRIAEFVSDATDHRKLMAEVEDLRVVQNVVNMTSIVSEADLRGDILTINEKFIEVSKYSREELIGAPHNTTRHPDMPKEVFKQLWGTIGKGKPFRGIIKNRAKDGTPYYVDAVIAPVLGANGKPRKYIGVRYDITESEIERQNAKGILNAIDNTFCYAEFTPTGEIIKTNSLFEASTGYSCEELNGKHHRVLISAERSKSREYDDFWRGLASGDVRSELFQNLSKAGRDVWFQAVYSPVRDETGRVTKIVMIGTDVTQQCEKNADYEGQLESINKSQATIEFDLDGNIRNANENFLATVGYSADEIKGKHHRIFVEPEFANSHEYKSFWDDLKAGKFFLGQYKRLAKGGREVWIQASYNPIFDLNGKPYKVVKYATDITASKQMEFRVAEKAKLDALAAEEMQRKVTEILTVAEKVAERDYSQPLTVSGDDVIGKLGEGLTQFFKSKQTAEIAEQERADRERHMAEEQSRKVSVVLEIVSAVAEGNFDIQVPDLGDDAIGKVGTALNQAVKSIRDALSEVRDVAGTVSTAAEQLTGASREIAAGAQTQASSLEETASSLEEITSTVKQNTDNAQQARQLANGSRDVAEKGGSVVSEAVRAMDEINESSKKIADIITTIDEIAFQTNLLALNAAVEAARAGEQGRGFAVVAAEVRNLAQRSASAAKEIKTLIQDSVGKVKNGADLVNKSGETLSEIVNSVKRVTDIVSEIAAASKEQLAGVEQVNRAVAQMDRVTQGNASQTEEMSGTADSLLSHSVQLSDLVRRFNLGKVDARDDESKRKSAHRSSTSNSHQRSQASERGSRFVPTFDLSTGQNNATLEF
ncbi:methyl-accepting chemotaxis protein [Pirellulaceae bacterium SH449]